MILPMELQQENVLLDIDFSQNNHVVEVLLFADMQFDVDFGEIHQIAGVDVPVFQGPYSVKPKLQDQILQTAGMLMAQDAKIEEIPIYVVSNNSGGDTVVIGG